jgi:hypothetical protein
MMSATMLNVVAPNFALTWLTNDYTYKLTKHLRQNDTAVACKLWYHPEKKIISKNLQIGGKNRCPPPSPETFLAGKKDAR